MTVSLSGISNFAGLETGVAKVFTFNGLKTNATGLSATASETDGFKITSVDTTKGTLEYYTAAGWLNLTSTVISTTYPNGVILTSKNSTSTSGYLQTTQIRWTPDVSAAGTGESAKSPFSVVAYDYGTDNVVGGTGTDNVSSSTVAIKADVIKPNSAPVIADSKTVDLTDSSNGYSNTAYANTDYYFSGTDLFNRVAASDVDGDTIQLQVTISTGTLSRNGTTLNTGDLISQSDWLKWTPVTDTKGEISAFTVTATDGFLDSTNSATVKITVAEQNKAPVIGFAPTDSLANGYVASPNLSINETATTTPFSNLTITDANTSDIVFLNVSMDDSNKGTLTLPDATDPFHGVSIKAKFTNSTNDKTLSAALTRVGLTGTLKDAFDAATGTPTVETHDWNGDGTPDWTHSTVTVSDGTLSKDTNSWSDGTTTYSSTYYNFSKTSTDGTESIYKYESSDGNNNIWSGSNYNATVTDSNGTYTKWESDWNNDGKIDSSNYSASTIPNSSPTANFWDNSTSVGTTPSGGTGKFDLTKQQYESDWNSDGVVDYSGTYYMLRGTQGNVQSAVRSFVFNPTDGRVSNGNSETTNFYLNVWDNKGWDPLTDWQNTYKQIAVISNAVNVAPVISDTAIEGFTVGESDSSVTISYADLLSKTGATDSVGTSLMFKVDTLTSGTLTKNGGEAVTTNTTTIGVNEFLTWTPAANATGNVEAFSVKAWDGELASTNASVSVSVTAKNSPPEIQLVDSKVLLTKTISETATTQPFSNLKIVDANANDIIILNVSVDGNGKGELSLASDTSGSIAAKFTPDETLAKALAATTIPALNTLFDNNKGSTPPSNSSDWNSDGVKDWSHYDLTLTGTNAGKLSADIYDWNNDGIADSNNYTFISTSGLAKNESYSSGNTWGNTYFNLTKTVSGVSYTKQEYDWSNDGISDSVYYTASTMTPAENGDIYGNFYNSYNSNGSSGLTGGTTVAGGSGTFDYIKQEYDWNNDGVMDGTYYTFRGTQNNLTANLQSLTYAPTDGRVLFGSSEDTRFYLSVQDGKPFPNNYDWSTAKYWNNDVVVTSQATNAAPVIDDSHATKTFTDVTEDTALTITYQQLLEATGATDVNAGQPLYFVVSSVATGTVKKTGESNNATVVNSTVADSTTKIDMGESLTWTPASNANGTITAFTVKAYDGTSLSTSSTAISATVTAVNDLPTGGVSISGVEITDRILTAANTLADVDGLGTISYVWKADNIAITGATNSTYTLKPADAGKKISVTASYTDAAGTLETVSSALTATIADGSSAPKATFGTGIQFDFSGNEEATSIAIPTIAIAPPSGTTVKSATLNGIPAGVKLYNAANTEITVTTGSADLSSLISNNAITGLYFVPNADYYGATTSGLSFSVTASNNLKSEYPLTLTVNPVVDAPLIVSNSVTTTLEDTQSGLIKIAKAAVDGVEVTHFKIANIAHGTLYQADGKTAISADSFITAAQATAGLKFTPSLNYNGASGKIFDVRGSLDGINVGGETPTPVNMAVTAVNDAPTFTVAAHAQTISSASTAQSVNAIQVTEVDGDDVTVDLNVINGKLSATANGATVSGSGTIALTVSGTATNVNLTLASLKYQQSSTNDDLLSISVQDSTALSAEPQFVSLTIGGNDNYPDPTSAAFNFASMDSKSLAYPAVSEEPLFLTGASAADVVVTKTTTPDKTIKLTVTTPDDVAHTLTLTDGAAGGAIPSLVDGKKVQFLDGSLLEINTSTKATLYGSYNAKGDQLIAGNSGDILYGYDGSDFLIGGSGGDTFYAGIGNDTIIGNLGNDILNGGTGNDVFVYHASTKEGSDTIKDFENGTDKIGLTVLADSTSVKTIATSGSDTLITLTIGTTIRLSGVANSDITYADFVLV